MGSKRFVSTGAGQSDYWVYTNDNGQTFYRTGRGNVSYNPNDITASNLEGNTLAAAEFENSYYTTTGRTLPGDLWDSMIHGDVSNIPLLTQALGGGYLRQDKDGLYIDAQGLIPESGSDAGNEYFTVDSKGRLKETGKFKDLKDAGLIRGDDYQTNVNQWNLDTAEDNAPDTSYTRPETVQDVMNEIDTVLGAGIPDAPEYKKVTTEDIDKYYGELTTREKPIEDESLGKVNEQYNFFNPYGLGSGKQIKIGSEVIQDLARDRYSRATGIAELENERAYNNLWLKWKYDYDQWTRAFGAKLDIAEFEENARQFGKGLDYQTWADTTRMGWQTGNTQLQRTWQEQDKEDERKFAREIGEMYKPSDSNAWLQFVSPIMTGAGYAMGGPLGGAIANGVGNWFSPRNYAQSSLPPSLSLYGGNGINPGGYLNARYGY